MAESRFSRRVDIKVPAKGLGQRLGELMDWCRDCAMEEEWAHHGFMGIDTGTDFARFYFNCPDTAAKFAFAFDGIASQHR